MKISNFYDDLENEVKSTLSVLGCPVPSFEVLAKQDKREKQVKRTDGLYNLENLVLHFYSVIGRVIPAQAYNVHVSNCLKNDVRIKEISELLTNGQSTQHLLSKRFAGFNQTKRVDLLLSEWGIYHLHFDEAGTNELLFIFIKGSDAYLLDILEHERPGSDTVTWTNTNLIQIIHDSWPEVIADAVYRSATGPEHFTTEERRALRMTRANVNVTVSDGTVYLPIGGGFMASGHALKARRSADYAMRFAKDLQKLFNDPAVECQFASRLSQLSASPRVSLVLSEKFEPQLVETTSKSLLNICFDQSKPS